ncbi:LAFE_0C07668g1_1 [Lachancea fermentati]|uniref:LAFE_0C07668g1_1 n=1 Tax=Lachancea fermentati TaxID=4955 RepID=A0A1G4MA48_LACFM|nr:LAFE_0C07668g1_1 [Lachancea fermentati]
MARYCDYCHSYLTHDTPSVRKSHLVGKNHVRLRMDYFCNKARQTHKAIFGKKKQDLQARRRARRNSKLRAAVQDAVAHSVALHCDTNRQKRHAHRTSHPVPEPIGVLEQLYRRAPGYAKVFRSDCRLDTGQSVRFDRLPQRANRRPNDHNRGFARARDRTSSPAVSSGPGSAAAPSGPATASRHTVYAPDYSDAGSTAQPAPLLPPPKSLAMWPTAPALVYVNRAPAEAIVRETTRRIERT